MKSGNTPDKIKPGDLVRLLTRPEGCSTQHLPLTVGSIYEVHYLDGSNVVTSTDVPGETGSYWRGRVETVNETVKAH